MSLSGTWDCPRCGRRNRARDQQCLNCRAPGPRGGRPLGTEKLPVPRRTEAPSPRHGPPLDDPARDPFEGGAGEATRIAETPAQRPHREEPDPYFLAGGVPRLSDEVVADEPEGVEILAVEVALEEAILEEEVAGDEMPLAVDCDRLWDPG